MTTSHPLIRLRTGTIIPLLEDTITLHPWQVREIAKYARTRTREQWHGAKQGIPIELTRSQREELILAKDAVINYLTPSRDPKELIRNPQFGFEPHAYARILERIERLTEDQLAEIGFPKYHLAAHPETLEKLAETLINSSEVEKTAHWKAFPYLTFTFSGSYDDRVIKLVLSFENGIVLVTVVVDLETGYFIREKQNATELLKNHPPIS